MKLFRITCDLFIEAETGKDLDDVLQSIILKDHLIIREIKPISKKELENQHQEQQENL